MAVRVGTNEDDELSGANGENNALFGNLGDDTLIGGADATNRLYGDWYSGTGATPLGDDELHGGANGTNLMYGDAYAYTGQGGDDLLVAGAGSVNTMFGDARSVNGVGGNDTLVSGTGADIMWGDAQVLSSSSVRGQDRFVFGPGSGHDVIKDFEPGRDCIDLSALEFAVYPVHLPVSKLPLKALAALLKTPLMTTGFDVLDSNANGVLDDADRSVTVSRGDTVIDLGAAAGGAAGVDTVTVIGQNMLGQGDFVF